MLVIFEKETEDFLYNYWWEMIQKILDKEGLNSLLTQLETKDQEQKAFYFFKSSMSFHRFLQVCICLQIQAKLS